MHFTHHSSFLMSIPTMRISIIGPFGLRPKGTMSVRALPLARALVARGHAVRVILPPWDFPEDAGLRLHDAGVEVENIELPAGVPGWFHVSTTRRLVRRALDFQPEVIHCFKPKAYAGLAAWWLWQLKRAGRVKARLIVDTDDWEGAGGWNDLGSRQSSAVSRQSSVVSRQYSWAQKKMFAWQEQWGLTHNDGVTVASRALQSIVWSLGVKPEHVKYVPNGVVNSESRIQNLEFRIPHSQLHILLYTRFFEFKIERVLEVLRRVAAQEPGAKLVVVGRGFNGEEEQLLQQAEAIGLRGSIEYAGWVDAAALPGYFAQASAAIHPFDDTLINRAKCSVKLIDLLSAGVPVVADAVGQNTEYIRHNETGLLVPGGDVAAMASAVVELLRDREKADRLGAQAARDVAERFSWDRLVESVEQAYGM
jgi:glycosyltransferase involved in cell wall biosynthesis